MSEPRGLLLKPPEKLPSTGVSKVSFKVFFNQLVAFLEQDPHNYMFMKDGWYGTWSPRQLGNRIISLSTDDTDHAKIQKEFTEKKVKDVYDAEYKKLLLFRNSQCAKFVQLIVGTQSWP
jgi:hypothetical protein